MLLRPGQVGSLQGLGLQAFVDIAVKRQRGGLAAGRRVLRLPCGIALGVQRRQVFAQVHQARNLLGRLLAQHADQLGSALGVQRCGGQTQHRGGHGGFVVKGLGGGQQEQHEERHSEVRFGA